jgi:hypothetical protein
MSMSRVYKDPIKIEDTRSSKGPIMIKGILKLNETLSQVCQCQGTKVAMLLNEFDVFPSSDERGKAFLFLIREKYRIYTVIRKKDTADVPKNIST